MTPLALCLGLLLAWLAARRAEGIVAEPLRLPAGDPTLVSALVARALPPTDLTSGDRAKVRAALAAIVEPAPLPAQPAISDDRLRAIAIGVRSRHDHITGVTAAEVTEMAVAFARQRGIELRGKP